MNYAEPFNGWQQNFGGQYGIFPKHLLDGKDIDAEMGAGYTWSGGPWMIDHWTTGVEVVLVPNENFWGAKPKLERVTFKIQADTAAEFESFQNREVAMIYPQPQPDVIEQIQAGLEGRSSRSTRAVSGNLEGIWMNNASPPLDDVNVRKAIAYSIDRVAIVEQLFGPLGVEQPMQTTNPPVLAEFADTEAFSDYELDLDMVDQLMTESGWEKNADGIWAKDGQAADLVIKTTTGNARRELTEQILQDQLRDAGFNLTTDNQAAGDLFGQQLPAGEFQLALYAQVATFITPGQCFLWCSKNIPTPENENSGQNWTRTNVPEVDPTPRGTRDVARPHGAWLSWARRPTRSWPRTWSRSRSTRCRTSSSGATRCWVTSATTRSSVRSTTCDELGVQQ